MAGGQTGTWNTANVRYWQSFLEGATSYNQTLALNWWNVYGDTSRYYKFFYRLMNMSTEAKNATYRLLEEGDIERGLSLSTGLRRLH